MILETSAAAAPRRFVSLDVFRGVTIFLMILVNTAGAGADAYPIMVHSKWFGFTLADFVFPSFLFAMGNAMCFSLRKPTPSGLYLRRIVQRGATIFLLGYLMYWFPFFYRDPHGWTLIPFSQTRVMGVLQRLGLSYIAAGILVRWLTPRQLIMASAVLLLGYWAILVGFAQPGMAYDKFANAGTRLDLWLFGQGHLYKKDGGFDPEGLLGTIPSIVNVLAGYLVGRAILRSSRMGFTAFAIAAAGAALTAAGLIWSPWFPIAKKLWTGSYVLLSVGLDCILLALLIALIELRGKTKGTRFFTILGRNPLAIYLFSELFVTALNMVRTPGGVPLYNWLGIAVFQQLAPGPLGSLLCALFYTMLCWALGWVLDRKGLMLRV